MILDAKVNVSLPADGLVALQQKRNVLCNKKNISYRIYAGVIVNNSWILTFSIKGTTLGTLGLHN